jgi:phosphoglycerol transferase MdoB-like AlkP superfamily enzyme
MRALSARKIYLLAATPLFWVAWFYLYVLRQRIHIGFWPLPSRPDPKDAGYIFHHLSIHLGVFLIPIITILAISFSVRQRATDKRFRWWRAIGLAAFSFVCYLGVMHLDPGDYWQWFLD